MTPTFEELLALARAGDEAALLELAQRYEPEVRAVARVRLGPALRPYLDTFDLVQSVHRSVMMGLRQNKFVFTGPEQLVALALTVVRRKVARQWRRAQRQVRPDAPQGDSTADLPSVLLGMRDDTPGPADAVDARDAVDELCRGLDAPDRELLELSAQGYRTVEIARRLGQNADVLRVRLSRLRAKLRTHGVSDDWL
ncbi:MAG TPA: sigma-70 family RNA polymerase sigma factor [Urbifossiella sp.]|nr:sigma-70 family RNA polymerase sigma factor [Urbifossiella sp.]